MLSCRTPDIGLAYIYFDHQQAQTLKPADYIANLVRQFEKQKQGLTTSIQSFYDKLPLKTERPDLEQLTSFLLDSAKSFSSAIYIIVDGFDECKEDGRKAVVDCLCSLKTANNRFRFLVATRPNNNVQTLASSFSDLARIIEVTTEKFEQTRDLKQFINGKLSGEDLEDEERSFLSKGILEKAAGS